ncbi:hypothetical protein Pmani_034912 [Petrolisthes manimaculis]|uniref:Uncharacterized protein n=1 Tax=Petrolisthes manimaculis TaxID=1843537 RepID=A0AAE1NND8_9EUCA|nr:hypothetical protein Pmani_034912 [Petrolisthes manimaculis]
MILKRVLDVLKRFGVFSADKTGSEILENIATKDQATVEITNALLHANKLDIFSRYVYQSGSEYSRIDIVFDRYQRDSVKAGTRIRRKKGVAPIRRITDSRDVPLPQEWQGFLHHQDNKADLARFLSEQLANSFPSDKTIVVAGGFLEETQVACNNPDVNTKLLESCHEESDTRMVFNCSDTTSFLSGHSKKTALKVFFKHKELLGELGKEPLTENTIGNVEQFVCRIYNVPEVTSVDKARVTLFKKALRPELLPPTRCFDIPY